MVSIFAANNIWLWFRHNLLTKILWEIYVAYKFILFVMFILHFAFENKVNAAR